MGVGWSREREAKLYKHLRPSGALEAEALPGTNHLETLGPNHTHTHTHTLEVANAMAVGPNNTRRRALGHNRIERSRRSDSPVPPAAATNCRGEQPGDDGQRVGAEAIVAEVEAGEAARRTERVEEASDANLPAQ